MAQGRLRHGGKLSIDWEAWKNGYRHAEYFKDEDSLWILYVSKDGELWIREEDAIYGRKKT